MAKYYTNRSIFTLLVTIATLCLTTLPTAILAQGDYRGCRIKNRWVELQDACEDHETCSLQCDCGWLRRDSYTIRCWESYNGGLRETTKRRRFHGGGIISSLVGGSESCYDEMDENGVVKTICQQLGGYEQIQCSCT